MRALASHPSARGLLDDAAVMDWPLGLQLVATHDMLVEGVHYTPDCPPADVAWKLLAVNLSDLAAMGARPEGVLLGMAFSAGIAGGWADAFSRGLARALEAYAVPLLGGDTVSGAGRMVLALTALGSVPPGDALGRVGACEGDDLWVSGTIGDAGVGLAVATGLAFEGAKEGEWRQHALRRYRRPTPRIELGLRLRGVAGAALDVSDGLALDAARLADANGLCAELQLDAVPLSSFMPDGLADRLRYVAAGDDYELLFAASPAQRETIHEVAVSARTPVTRIGSLLRVPEDTPLIARIRLLDASGLPIEAPQLGYEHRWTEPSV